MIFEPGRKARMDVHATTSAADILPTLLYLTGHKPASWTEGTVLPPFAATEPNPDRPAYALHAKENAPDAPLTVATAMLVKGKYKLTYYFGYPEMGAKKEIVELYDIEADPQELKNLYSRRKTIGRSLLAELKQKLKESDRPNG
jgi:arylsulfatase A-like enzyme